MIIYIALTSQRIYCETALQLTNHGKNDVCWGVKICATMALPESYRHISYTHCVHTQYMVASTWLGYLQRRPSASLYGLLRFLYGAL